MAIVSFSGLASNVQWRDLIDEMMTLESRPAVRLREKIDAAKLKSEKWAEFRTVVETLRTAAKALEGTGLKNNRVMMSWPSGVSNPLAAATASVDAAPGTHAVRVLALARAETLSGEVFASRTTAVGAAGEFRVNGKRIEVVATDSLDAIVKKLNDANSGGATGVTASVLTTGTSAHRLVLSSTKTGKTGIDLSDGAAGVLRTLGLLDANLSIKTATTSGAMTDALADAVTEVATLLGYTSPPAAGTVTIGGVNVALDLSLMSLTDVADAINTAATLAGRGVTATVVDEGNAKRLDIRGATSYTDANGILEALGVLEGGRSAVAQVVHSDVLESAAGTPATAGTLLTGLWAGGALANVQAGDTLNISGTRGDGSTFAFDVTIGAGDTVQTLLNRLNSAVDGFQAGTSTATASISATGEITVTDDVGGESRLSLNIVANNEGGGSLDFGTFQTGTAGRSRVISAGADAEFEINGSYLSQSTNTVIDAVPGLTLNLARADAATTVQVNVSRDTDASVAAIQAMVDAYNKLGDFVNAQLAPPPEGKTAQPLYNDSVLRTMRASLRNTLGVVLDATVTGGLSRLAEIGIEVDRAGRYTVDAARLKTAVETQPDAVARLFGVFGTATGSGLSYIDSSSKTVPGTYAVDITTAAVAASITGAGFGGAYIDDATADTLSIRDLHSNRTYSVALSNGMTLSAIVDALNEEFTKAREHIVAAGAVLYSDAAGTTPANDTTVWADVRLAGGANPAVANGDVLTISGTRTDGSSFLASVAMDTAATLGQLRQAVQSAIGTDVAVTWENGVLTSTSKAAGSKTFTLSVTSDNAGGGTLDFGVFAATQEGRGTVAITASDNAGQLQLSHADAGSTAGFEISYVAGGADGSASLGLAAAIHAGVDVAGTIGGFAATGAGRILTGATGTPIEGLLARYEGAALGAIGSITFSRGLGTRLGLVGDTLLGSDAGSISDVTDRLDSTVAGMESRIDTIEDRLERRREELIRRFTAMEQAIARAQAQSAWLESQLRQFDSQGNR
jgi:flagellar hook-associated protein 2